MKNYEFPEKCPAYLKQDYYDTIRRFLTKGINPGQFMTAVLSNNLMDAMARADEETVGDLKSITMFIYNDVPGMCHGTRAKVSEWLQGGHREYDHG